MPATKTVQPDGTPSQPPSEPAPRRTRRAASAPAPGVEPDEGATPASGRPEPAAPEPVAAEADSAPSVDEDGAWVQAETVEVHQGAIGRVDAADVAVTQGAIGAARGDRVSVEMGMLGAALGREVSISQGGAGSILAQEARVEQSFVRTLVAQDVDIRRPSVVVFLIAQRVNGDIRPLLDWRGALVFGAVAGVMTGLFGRLRRRR